MTSTQQAKNRYGLCEAQIAYRLQVVKELAGVDKLKQIESVDIKKYDHKLWIWFINHGGIKKAMEKLGVEYKKFTYSNALLIAGLRKFAMENKRMPICSDLNQKSLNGLSGVHCYINHFGSWRRAKMMAGLDQLLEEVKSK